MISKYYFFMFLITSLTVHALPIEQVELSGYARAGVGTNWYGGAQECFYNQGSGGWNGIGRNEWRLGNECSNYLELGFKINHFKEFNPHRYFYTQIRFANQSPGNDTWDSSQQTTSLTELYSEGTLVENSPIAAWVGKRYYRDSDVYIDDYYYFANMSGNGAGVRQIPLVGEASMDIAYLQQVGSTQTDLGYQATSVLDFRINKLKFFGNTQRIWFAYAQSPGGTKSNNLSLDRAQGYALGVLNESQTEWFSQKIYSQLSIQFGQKLMNDFNLWTDRDWSQQNQEIADKSRWRAIWSHQVNASDKNSYYIAFSTEKLFLKNNLKEEWLSMGLAHVYGFNSVWRLHSVLGHSQVSIDDESYSLGRVTIAPELSLGEGFWSRPVLRFYMTESFWSQNNQSRVKSQAPTFANLSQGGSWGFQMESMF